MGHGTFDKRNHFETSKDAVATNSTKWFKFAFFRDVMPPFLTYETSDKFFTFDFRFQFEMQLC